MPRVSLAIPILIPIALSIFQLACGAGTEPSSPVADAAPGDATAVDAVLDSAVPGPDAALPDSSTGVTRDGGADAAASDSGAGNAAGDADLYEEGGLACGPLTCSVATAYCFTFGVEVGPPGGGTGYECSPLPPECLSNHTCACLRANYDGGFGVTVEGCDGGGDAGITLTAELP